MERKGSEDLVREEAESRRRLERFRSETAKLRTDLDDLRAAKGAAETDLARLTDQAATVRTELSELESDDLRARNRKVETAIDRAADELMCPITLELPVDPVMAEDGKIYERSAIEEHIARNRRHLTSPMTREPMGTTLLPATQVRNLINALVHGGTLSGDKANRWRQMIADEEEVADAMKEAADGDAEKMYQLGSWHRHREKGLPNEPALAYKWFKAAADLHHVRGMGMAGRYLLLGIGGEENRVEGASLITLAAAQGCERAAYTLARYHSDGSQGFPKDTARARYWFGKVADGACSLKDAETDLVRRAAEFLRHLDSE